MAETMRALVNYGPEPDSVELRDVPRPEPAEHDALLRVDAVGVCGSDVHQWQGSHSWRVAYPCVLGHEFTGTIVRVGSGVRGFEPGMRVVSETAAVIDAASPFTREGRYQLDPSRLGFGYGVDGAMAPYVVTPARTLHRIPDELEPEVAAVTEPCCVAYAAVCETRSVRPGDVVLVLGPGPIGILCAMMARLAGAGRVVMAGTPADGRRLALAAELGADDVLAEGLDDHVAGLGDGHGVDLTIDAAGVSTALQAALRLTRPAGTIVKVGWGRDPLGFSLDPLVQKALTLRGSFSHNWPVWERVIRLLAERQLDPRPLISHVAPLEAWRAAFEGMHRGTFAKAVLRP
jgi:L-iditol 2-dehydrogenase